jgi:hypothetical protein
MKSLRMLNTGVATIVPAVTGHVWFGGNWNWVGNRHVWVAGHWGPGRPGAAGVW